MVNNNSKNNSSNSLVFGLWPQTKLEQMSKTSLLSIPATGAREAPDAEPDRGDGGGVRATDRRSPDRSQRHPAEATGQYPSHRIMVALTLGQLDL